jgi:hypothetical protein
MPTLRIGPPLGPFPVERVVDQQRVNHSSE